MKILLFMAMCLLSNIVNSQEKNIRVFTSSTKGEKKKLVGASIINAEKKLLGTTDSTGNFNFIDSTSKWIYVDAKGYDADSIEMKSGVNDYSILLLAVQNLQEVDIIVRNYDTDISLVKIIKVENIGKAELKKAACCNLAESFESNASVDVVYTDAVSGARTIQMLGLSGLYTPIQIENVPYTRGLGANYGMSFIPGTWLQGIQITKGVGSVVNGYESMAGIINIELIKPEADKTERLFVNVYGNNFGRAEANVHLNKKLNEKWSTLLFLHGNGNYFENDMNKDGFRDNPLSNQMNVMNRWKHAGKKTEQVIIMQSMYDDKTGGQIGAKGFSDDGSKYGVGIRTKMHQVIVKNGFLFPNKKMASLGLIGSFKYQSHQSQFGKRIFNALQESIYFNSIYNNYIVNEKHTFKTGASLVYDKTNMKYNSVDTTITEIVPGVYGEYSFNPNKTFNALLGGRIDYHNVYGVQYTPRMHLRYLINEKISVRALAGTGFRTSKTLIENVSALASSRTLYIDKNLQPEKAFNTGISYSQEITVVKRKWMLNLDYYYTKFLNQVVVDYDKNPQELHFYNLTGQSFAQSAQVELDMEIAKGLQFRVAYKHNIVKQTTNGELQEKVFVSPGRTMANVHYETANKKWKIDFINNYIQSARLPHTESNPSAYQFPSRGKSLYIMHLQVTKLFRKFEIYLGSENMLNQRQLNAIVSASNPFGTYFDAGMIWGPLNGRTFYGGLRYGINK